LGAEAARATRHLGAGASVLSVAAGLACAAATAGDLRSCLAASGVDDASSRTVGTIQSRPSGVATIAAVCTTTSTTGDDQQSGKCQ